MAGGGSAWADIVGFLSERRECLVDLYDVGRSSTAWKRARRPCEDARVADWDDLRFFLAVHRAGTLAAAGKALKVDHTTVGRRLRGLESALGARLLERRRDRL